MTLYGNVIHPAKNINDRPSPSTPGRLFYNEYNGALQADTGMSWITIGGEDGSSEYNSARSAAVIKNLTGTSTNGTYWITIDGSPTKIYCDMTTSGGGWMSFASVPGTGGWFSGDTGLVQPWSTLQNYYVGTYSPEGNIGNYWRDWSKQSVSQLLFKTGNGTYWIVINISDIYQSPNGISHTVNAVATSNNFPATQYEPNTKVTIMHRSPNGGEDPWINAGNVHANGNETNAFPNTTDYMFWGENQYSTTHVSFKNGNGGILAFVR